MAKISSSDYKDVYKNQETALRPSSFPPSGTYDVWPLSIEAVKTTNSAKYKPNLLILAVVDVDAADKEEAAGFVGETFTTDLWRDVSKKRNARTMACMAIAASRNAKADWDTEDPGDVVANLCAGPFRITIEVEGRPARDGTSKMFYDANVVEFKALSAADVKKYAENPDTLKRIPKPEDRYIAERSREAPQGDGDDAPKRGRGRSAGPKSAPEPDPFDTFDPNKYAP